MLRTAHQHLFHRSGFSVICQKSILSNAGRFIWFNDLDWFWVLIQVEVEDLVVEHILTGASLYVVVCSEMRERLRSLSEDDHNKQ